MVTPNNPRKYTGTTQYITPNVVRNRRPTGSDFRQPETGAYYTTACIWQVGLTKNPDGAPLPPVTGTQGELWMLSRIVANVATWVQLSDGTAGAGPVLTLSDDANTLVPPTVNGNIQIAGTAHEVAVTAGVNELVISQPNGIPFAEIVTDVTGPAFPTNAGLVNFTGATSTFTAGPGVNTVRTEVQGANHTLKIGRGNHVASVDLPAGVGVSGQILQAITGSDPVWAGGIQTWTPTIVGSTGAGTATYTAQLGQYSQIGNILFFWATLTWNTHTGTGNMQMGGWPVNFPATQLYTSTCALVSIAVPANTLWVNLTSNVGGGNLATFTTTFDNAVGTPVQMSAAGSVIVSGSYSLV